MPKIVAILRHEFRLAAANKAYVVLTILGPFLILAITILPGLLSMSPAASSGGAPVAVAVEAASGSGPGASALAALASAAEKLGRKLVKVEAGAETLAAAKAGVSQGGYAALILLPSSWEDSGATVFTKTGTEAVLYGAVEAALGEAAREIRARRSGVDPALARELSRGVALSVVKLGKDAAEEESGDQEFMTTLFTVMSFVMLLYMTTLLYGQLIGRSVVQEKTSKTVEIMLSSVSARELMFGKILGLGLAGLLQYGVWAGIAVLLSTFAAPALGLSAPAAVSPANLGWLVLFFVLAFFLYASGYAAIGAAAEDEHDLGQLAWPLLVFLIVPLVMISSFVMNPDSSLSVALSLFPMTSPIVMLVRILVSPPPAWQVALSLGVLLASIYAMASGAARIFRVGILMTGKRRKLKEILRWARAR